MYHKTKELRATISMPKLAIFWTSLVPFRDAIRTRHKLHILCISAPIPLHQCSDVRQERLKSRKLALPKPDNPAHQLSKRRSRRRLKIASAIGRMKTTKGQLRAHNCLGHYDAFPIKRHRWGTIKHISFRKCLADATAKLCIIWSS